MRKTVSYDGGAQEMNTLKSEDTQLLVSDIDLKQITKAFSLFIK